MSELFDEREATLACPGCGQPLDAAAGEVARMVDCPACEERFVIPAVDGSTEIPDEMEETIEERDKRREDELNNLRVRAIVTTRRAAIRSRTYCLLGMMLSFIGGLKLLTITWSYVRAVGWHARPVIYVACSLPLFVVSVWLLLSAAYWERESRAGVIPEPTTPPDFSTLSDGSQAARNLENMHG